MSVVCEEEDLWYALFSLFQPKEKAVCSQRFLVEAYGEQFNETSSREFSVDFQKKKNSGTSGRQQNAKMSNCRNFWMMTLLKLNGS